MWRAIPTIRGRYGCSNGPETKCEQLATGRYETPVSRIGTMRKFLLGVAVSAIALVATAQSASAQHKRNVIVNSGNGVGNTIVAKNSGGFPIPFGGSSSNLIANSGNGIGNTIVAKNSGGFPSPFGGLGTNIINNSGNGIGNTIIAGNAGGSFPGGGVFPGGVNVNVVTNSGNGVGNTILTGNSRPGGLNVNVITNSGNGASNVIRTGNR